MVMRNKLKQNPWMDCVLDSDTLKDGIGGWPDGYDGYPSFVSWLIMFTEKPRGLNCASDGKDAG